MRIAQLEIFNLDDLDASSREVARSEWRENHLDYDLWDCTVDDAKEIAALMGIDISNVYFSGFRSQGDGACFEGEYTYRKGATTAVKAYAPKDATLHRIAADLQEAQRKAFYRLSASVSHTGRYSHKYCTTITVYDGRDGYGLHAAADEHDGIAKALRDFMRWVYRQLEAEHSWQMADEQIDESIRSSGVEFTEDGQLYP